MAVTQGILQVCTWSELRGVLAHEISHVRNRDILTSSVAAAIAMGITFLARMAAWGGLFMGGLGGGGRGRNDDENILGLLAMMILAPLAATMLQLALSRSREYEADRDGARLIGDGEPLAAALSKLDRASQQVPMAGPVKMAALFIVNPLRVGASASPIGSATTRPPTRGSSGCGHTSGRTGFERLRAGGPAAGPRQSRKFSNCNGIPKSCSLKLAIVACSSSRSWP